MVSRRWRWRRAGRDTFTSVSGWACSPNTALTLATLALGGVFRNELVLWFGTAMSIAIMLTYLFVLANHVRAVWAQDFMYLGRDEDVEDD